MLRQQVNSTPQNEQMLYHVEGKELRGRMMEGNLTLWMTVVGVFPDTLLPFFVVVAILPLESKVIESGDIYICFNFN